VLAAITTTNCLCYSASGSDFGVFGQGFSAGCRGRVVCQHAVWCRLVPQQMQVSVGVRLADGVLEASVAWSYRQHCAPLCCVVLRCAVLFCAKIIINPCKPYLTASAPRLTHWGAVLCCAVLCCAVLCCIMYVVLCCSGGNVWR
jgi:hypothetical protein